eukprot:COSAG01_NODE_9814_length_2334_cov_2.346309_3_plen_35_part_01
MSGLSVREMLGVTFVHLTEIPLCFRRVIIMTRTED